jgi:hypothetical protein
MFSIKELKNGFRPLLCQADSVGSDSSDGRNAKKLKDILYLLRKHHNKYNCNVEKSNV